MILNDDDHFKGAVGFPTYGKARARLKKIGTENLVTVVVTRYYEDGSRDFVPVLFVDNVNIPAFCNVGIYCVN